MVNNPVRRWAEIFKAIEMFFIKGYLLVGVGFVVLLCYRFKITKSAVLVV